VMGAGSHPEDHPGCPPLIASQPRRRFRERIGGERERAGSWRGLTDGRGVTTFRYYAKQTNW
jgi:hypothetical protein